MAIFEITHINDTKFKRDGRVFFGVGNCKTDDDYETNYSDNMAEKNYSYCELTAFYCIFKNFNKGIVGIEHYRRAFLSLAGGFLTEEEAENILRKRKIILPVSHEEKEMSMYQFYTFNHFQSDFEILRDIIRSDYPDYLNAFNAYFTGKSTYYFNMMICKKEFFDAYCSFVFPILAKVEETIKQDNDLRITFQKRTFGYLSERLLNVWVLKNFTKNDIYELPVAILTDGKEVKKSKIRIFFRRIKYWAINRKR